MEANDINGAESSFYRTDSTGDNIRRSALENNLPPSVGDRMLQTLQASSVAQTEKLSIISAAPRLWDGCYGLATEGGVCAEIAVFGWQVVVTDTPALLDLPYRWLGEYHFVEWRSRHVRSLKGRRTVEPWTDRDFISDY